MTIDKIYDLRENNFFDQNDVQKIDLLLQAVTDWPTPVDTIEGFLTEVKNFLKVDILTYEAIRLGINKFSPKDFSWELESLTSLLELAKIEKDKGLNFILFDCKVIDNI